MDYAFTDDTSPNKNPANSQQRRNAFLDSVELPAAKRICREEITSFVQTSVSVPLFHTLILQLVVQDLLSVVPLIICMMINVVEQGYEEDDEIMLLASCWMLSDLVVERSKRHIGADIRNAGTNIAREFELNASYWCIDQYGFHPHQLDLLVTLLGIPFMRGCKKQKFVSPGLALRISLHRLIQRGTWIATATVIGGGGVVDNSECTNIHGAEEPRT